MIIRRIMSSIALSKLKKKTPKENQNKSKKKINRFDGLTEEEVEKYTLPDYLEMNLDMVFVGINPSLMAAYRGRYYAGPGNHFYKLLCESGLTPRCLTYEEDYKLPQYGIGLTNIVERATKSSANLKRTEIKEGSEILKEKLHICKPKIAVFNGKCIYEVFANKTNFNFGLQPECIGDTAVWVTPSSSARCANFPKMTDKLHFFISLKKYLQFLKGEIKNVDINEFLFEGKCKQFIPRTSKMWRRKNMSAFLYGGRIANKNTVCLDMSDENVAIAHSTEFIVNQTQIATQETCKKVETSDTNETKLLENSEACSSQDNAQTFFEDNVSKQSIKSEVMAGKIQVSNNRKKRNVKRLPQKSGRIKNYHENNSDLDFINLIKQRLTKKLGNNCNKEK